jgi:cytosine/adenosine deaminase-related metal-dependent hydrolase
MEGEGLTRLVRGSFVVTAANAPPVRNAAVVVEGDTIREVIGWDEARRRYPRAELIGSETSAVMPGLINAHHHSHAVTWIQHGLREQPLEPYLLGFPAVRDYDRYHDALICGARLLSTGVTATIDLFTGDGSASAFARDLRQLIRGYETAGLRTALAAGISTRSFLVYGEDDRFIDSLPAELRAAARSLIPDVLPDQDYFDVMADVAEGIAAGSRVGLWYAAPGPEWVSDAFLQRILEHAKARGTCVQTHAVETLYAKLAAHHLEGRSSIRHLEALGVLGPHFGIAHGVWLDEAEIGILARTGTSVSHNPGSNLRVFGGIAPLNALRDAGVTVGLGMDANTLNDDEDMFQEMRLALRLHRRPEIGQPAPSPADILELATTGGARILRKETRLGRLASGYAADIVVVDMERLSWPWVAPECDPLTLLLLRASRRDVDTVLVGGEVVFRDGAPTRFDLAEAMRALAEEIAPGAYPSERANAARKLVPHLEAWYRAWPMPRLEPYGIYNSRN